jgi:hypothetical protein
MAGPGLGARPLPLIEPQLIESEPAHRAVLARGVPPVHFQKQWAVPLTLVPQLPSQFAECGVLDRTGTSPARQSPNIQVFNGDDTKFPHQTSRQSMQRVLACLPHPHMSARDSPTLLLTPMAPLLPPCQTPLLLAQVPQASLIAPGVWDLPCGEGRQVCQAEIYPYQLARAWKQGARNPCAAESPVLIPQALCQGRGRHLSQPLMPCRAFPPRQPSREINAREGESTGAVCFRANSE